MNQKSDNGVMQMSHGVMSGLTTTPMTQSSTMMVGTKDYILTKGLHPGDASPTESRLCTDLGISCFSVRETAHALVALDIVEVHHRYGVLVGQVSMRPMVKSLVFKGLLNPRDDHHGLCNIVEVRVTLDNTLTEPVTHAWHNRHDLELNILVGNTEHFASQDKLFTDQDRCFHTRLLQPLDNHLYFHLAEASWAIHTPTVPLLDAPKLEDLTSTVKVRRAVLQAAHAGDTPTYHKVITDHYALLPTVLA